jgi:hypothetical protein
MDGGPWTIDDKLYVDNDLRFSPLQIAFGTKAAIKALCFKTYKHLYHEQQIQKIRSSTPGVEDDDSIAAHAPPRVCRPPFVGSPGVERMHKRKY